MTAASKAAAAMNPSLTGADPAKASAAATAGGAGNASYGAKALQVLSACSWRAPLVIGPYLWYVNGVYQDALTKSDPFSQVSFLTPAIGTTLYLAFVYFGQKFMADRKAFDPSQWMLVYNLYQTCMNIYCVYAFLYEVTALGGTYWGLFVDRTPRGSGLGFVIWLHYNNKYMEFLDTVFMVLRKKTEQVSFLHVYHHWLLVWSWYLVCTYACGGDAYFGAIMNSFIHVVMYGYYLLAALKLPCPWKPYVTQLQLLQFVVCATHASYVIYLGDEHFPRWLAALDIFVMTNMFVLFTMFYKKAYAKKAAAKKAAAKKAAAQKTE